MSATSRAKHEVVLDYLHRYPSIGSTKIAELIIEEVPRLFEDCERARSMIRYYRGMSGEKHRKGVMNNSYTPKVSMPASDEESYEPYLLGEAFPMLVCSDIHIPYHDQDALEIALERGIDIGAKTVILLGDVVDFYQASIFTQDPRRRDVADEIAMLREVLTRIRAAFPKANIVYKFGNHEERFDLYLMRNAPALFGLESMHLKEQVGLAEMKIDVVTNKRLIRAGHLNLIHGHEYSFSISNPVNPARGLYLRAKKSTLCGHFHQSSNHTERSINGDIISCWSLGCLCGLHPEYRPLNSWSHGFAEIYHDEEEMFSVKNRLIVRYRLV